MTLNALDPPSGSMQDQNACKCGFGTCRLAMKDARLNSLRPERRANYLSGIEIEGMDR